MLKDLLSGNIFFSDDGNTGGDDGSKKLSQEEVDRIISVRLERANAKHQEELAKKDEKIKSLGFESYDDVARLKGERDQYEKQANEYKQALTRKERVDKVKKLGVADEFVDYVLFQVKDDEALEDFLKENPRLKAESFNKTSSNLGYKGDALRKLDDAESDEDYLRLRREKTNG